MTLKTPQQRYLSLFLALLIPLAIGGTAGFFTVSGIGSWYSTLNKPWFNPPNWIFGPVWTTLYLVMGYSSWRIWQLPHSPQRSRALNMYWIQLFFNFWWSILFFHFENPGLALAEILVLWICIVLMILHFFKLDRVAGWIQIPYLLWVSFATALTAAIFNLNP